MQSLLRPIADQLQSHDVTRDALRYHITYFATYMDVLHQDYRLKWLHYLLDPTTLC